MEITDRIPRVLARCLVTLAVALPLACCSGGSAVPSGLPAPNDPDVFAVPDRIVVAVAPFNSLDEALAAESRIDWLRDPASGNAVTLAYAAAELRDHLARGGIAATVMGPGSSARPAIVLSVRDPRAVDPVSITGVAVDYDALGAEGYAIVPYRGSVYVTASNRTGLLYGTYALLEQLGFRWPDPYETLVPNAAKLRAPLQWRTTRAAPRVGLRGFWVYATPPVPDAFAIWLARNRLNVGGRPRLELQRKLGIRGWGGHHDLLQQEFSRPGLFENHPDWFGMRGSVRQPVTADVPDVYFNPAFSNPAAAAYFADRLVPRLESGDLRDLDVVNVWPSDDRFNTFDQSPEARALGNETDTMLFFYANVARRLQEAFESGRLSRRVTLAGFAYFQTAEPPTNRTVVSALEPTNFLLFFSPLERDWSGPIDTDLPNRESNRLQLAQFEQWNSMARLKYGVIEYHNLSLYGGIALTDFPAFARNFEIMTRGRDSLYAYMHPNLRNPGPRRLTNRLLSKLTWRDLDAPLRSSLEVEADAVIAEYFAERYGEHATEWRAIYESMSRSVENAKEMFNTNSLSWVLLQEQVWSPPIYPRAQAAAYVARYRAGGAQDLPAGFSGGTYVRATFRGLDESLRLQSEASRRWTAVLSNNVPADVRRNMESDVEWFESTASRYRLLAAASDFVLARAQGGDVGGPRDRIAVELQFLRSARVLRDTVSPVNQTVFIDLNAALAGLPRTAASRE